MRALRQLIGCRYPKNIDEIIKESIKLRYPFQHFSTVIISQRDIIQSIGQSKRNNLILDNFGEALSGIFRTPIAALGPAHVLHDDGDVARDVWFMAVTASTFNAVVAQELGSQIKVGSGTTAATRADFDIETAFIVGPEDAEFDTGPGSYAAGAISIAGAITAGGAGTINETGMFGKWSHVAAAALFMLFHDILVSGEAFVLGNTITVAYTINL